MNSQITNCKIICLTEHWQSSDALENIQIDNFKLVASYCRPKGYGGAAVYLHQSVVGKERKKLSHLSVQGEFECAVAECVLNSETFLIFSIYRPPNGNIRLFIDKMDEVLTEVFNGDKSIIIAGTSI